jgi:hypothetical protein
MCVNMCLVCRLTATILARAYEIRPPGRQALIMFRTVLSPSRSDCQYSNNSATFEKLQAIISGGVYGMQSLALET